MALAFSMSSLAAFADWLEFRGPSGAGHSSATGLPVHWSETEQVAWKTEIDGLAWSSPVIVGKHIYLTTAVEVGEEERSLRLVCLKTQSGQQIWEKEIFLQQGKVKIHKKNSHASPTPIIEGNHLYLHFGPYGTACTTLDGDIVWKQKLEYAPTHGNGGSPALADDLLVICCDGSDQQFVVGLDKQTGDIRWKTERDTDPKKGFSFSTPLVMTINGQLQAICPGSDAVFSYNARSGEEIWRVDYPDGYSVIPRPVYGAGLVFLSSSYDKPTLYAIDPTGTGNVTESHVRWTMDRGAPHTPSVLVVGDELYCVSDKGIATCVDARTGEQHWQERLGGNFSASPFYADGHIYFQNETGEATVIKPGKSYEEVTRNQIGNEDRTFASYAVDGQSLIIRSESALYRIDP
ncbi:MAG: PQQ-binding-like beta-propeller repeat protein [Planctomycetaceae bacterium]|nr:PQQ-binding-like beta-propeller repeat protein [Planctomycetaceae bacterium]